MKFHTLILTIVTTLWLSACALNEPLVKKEVELIPTPVPFCPAPPEFTLPKLSGLKMITLTSTPGEVAQAYEYEVAYLNALNQLKQIVIDAYKNNAVDLEKLRGQINKTIDDANAKLSVAPATPAPTK